ncbi:hypothetical protein EG832_20680, partial [bacterium]|nr:hypothetical protein [bacterium]
MIGGVNIIELNDSLNRVINIYEPETDYPQVVTFLSIASGPDGTIWLGSYGNGLFSTSDNENKERIIIEPSPVNSLVPEMMIWDILCIQNGETWLATDKNGVIRTKNGKILSEFNTGSGLQSNQILGINEDKDGFIWFASFGQGAMIYAGEKMISYDQEDGLQGLQVLDIHSMPGNILYVATEEGLLKFRINGERLEKLQYFNEANGLNAPGSNAIEQSDDGRLWIGTTNGINILKGSALTQFDGNRSLGNKNVNCLKIAGNNDVWVGTIGGYARIFDDNLFFMDQEDGLVNDEIQTIIEDSKNRIWLGTLGGIVKIEGTTYTDYNSEDGLTTLKVNALVENPLGNILIGTSGGG